MQKDCHSKVSTNNVRYLHHIVDLAYVLFSHFIQLGNQFQGGLTSGRRPVVKIIAESLSQHDEKHVVPTPLSGIRGGRKDTVGKRLCRVASPGLSVV
jgi:hypothetical protein